MTMLSRIRNTVRARLRRRYGRDEEPLVISNRRVYILPTRLGAIFSGLLFLMFLGSLNYANNLALGLTFLLSALTLIAMHHCHRNLVGIRINSAPNEPVFAGDVAQLHVALSSAARTTRYEIAVGAGKDIIAKPIEPNSRTVLSLFVPTSRRGRVSVDEFVISTRFPFGLFRAWTYAYLPLSCVVYPQRSAQTPDPPAALGQSGNLSDRRSGDDDFAGLRRFQMGDSPQRIAWKQYAHGQALQAKVFVAASRISREFDFESLAGLDMETRLSILCRWIDDAHNAQLSFGLKLPGVQIEVQSGNVHRQRCLTALALFGLDANHGK